MSIKIYMNGKLYNKKEEDLFLKTITVDEGPSMKRFKAGARGRAFPFKRRTSHITVTLDEKIRKSIKTEKKIKKVKKVNKKS